MNNTTYLILTVLISYLLGSVSSAILVGKLFGVKDIRNHGSGNAGATNALRVAGKGAAALTFLFDGLKAVVAVIIARLTAPNEAMYVIGSYTAALMSVVGHDFPVFFKFKGGKGIVTSCLAIMMLDWRIGLAILVFAIVIMAITKYVSLGSVSAAVLYLVLTALLYYNHAQAAFILPCAAVMTALAVWRHSQNIKRLLSGTERKLGQKE